MFCYTTLGYYSVSSQSFNGTPAERPFSDHDIGIPRFYLYFSKRICRLYWCGACRKRYRFFIYASQSNGLILCLQSAAELFQQSSTTRFNISVCPWLQLLTIDCSSMRCATLIQRYRKVFRIDIVTYSVLLPRQYFLLFK